MVRTWWPHTKRMVWFLVALGTLIAHIAIPTEALAGDPFDINTLSVDEENRFSNVGVFIVAIVDRVSGVGVAKATSMTGCERVERVVDKHVVHSAAREERSTGLSRKSRLNNQHRLATGERKETHHSQGVNELKA